MFSDFTSKLKGLVVQAPVSGAFISAAFLASKA
jgi:hypothetical protein